MTDNSWEETRMFRVEKDKDQIVREILAQVYQALVEKDYQPINQLVGYLLSGDPAYVTSHKNARNLIRQMERDELLEELLRSYLQHQGISTS